MRNKLLILLLLLAVVGFAFGLTIKNSEPQTTDQPTTQDQPGDATDIETVIISPEKPASFEGVEMVTYKSPAGYEITYPVQWIAKEVPAPAQSNDIFARYSISPVEPLDKLMNPMIIIRVWKTDKNFLQPDASLREKQIALNGQKGGFSPGLSGADGYYFLKNSKIYSMYMVTGFENYDISQQEALWVLSTFKITD